MHKSIDQFSEFCYLKQVWITGRIDALRMENFRMILMFGVQAQGEVSSVVPNGSETLLIHLILTMSNNGKVSGSKIPNSYLFPPA